MASGLGAIRVLVVDDNAQMRMLVRSMLRGIGIFNCGEAGSVADGIAELRKAPTDVVLLDLAMKPDDGIEFVRRVRRMTGSPNPFLSIIMMTGLAQRPQVAAARDAGVNSFLAKPISGRSLAEHLLAAIKDSRPFVRADNFFGPDRRHGPSITYAGPLRRESDKGESFDIDDAFAAKPALAG
jgi:CheY-like chemotaxis protein